METLIMIILILSSLIQFLAASQAINMIRLSGYHYSWLLISVGLFLMGLRRIIPLYYLLSGQSPSLDIANESIGLALSLFMLFGTLGIKSVFLDKQKSANHIQQLLGEKELILKEVHHRIKNNMSTVGSLLSLQQRRVKDPDAINALSEAHGRIQSMMTLYDKLYQSNHFQEVSLKSYFSTLCQEIIQNFPMAKQIHLEQELEDISLSPKIVPALALIVNELLTNIMKYAFAETPNPQLIIRAFLTQNILTMIITDNGFGKSRPYDLEQPQSFGLILIKNLTEQLKGSIHVTQDKGTQVQLKFTLN